MTIIRQKMAIAVCAGIVLLSVPVAILVAPIIGPLDGPRLIDDLVAWVYAIILLSVSVALTGYRFALPAILPTSIVDWLSQPVAGQTRGVWGIALVAIVAGVLLFVPRINPLDQAEATWVRMSVDLPSDTPPPATVQIEPSGKVIAVQWQPYATTQVAIWARQGQTRILAVADERGQVARNTIELAGAQSDSAGILLNADRALLSWPQSSRSITLTLAAGDGSATLFWLDQQQNITLGPQPTQVFFTLPSRFQGWALLPAVTIQQLKVAFPKITAPIAIHAFDIMSSVPQQIALPRTMWATHGCNLQEQNHVITFVPASVACSVALVATPTANQSQYGWPGALAVSVLVALLLMGGLWLLTQAAKRWPWLAALAPDTTHLPVFRRAYARGWSTGRIALIVWIVAFGYHLTYSMVTPMAYTNDSVDYYTNALQLIDMPRFAALTGVRTPGYPGFLALIVMVFGTSGVAVSLLQHGILAALGPITFWLLVGRVPLPAAILAGVSAGVSPMISITGNILWTEPLYTALTTIAVLLSVDRVRMRRTLLVGMLVGAATMVRPAGLLLLAVLIGWELLVGWVAISQHLQRRAVMRCLAFACGYCVIAGPWHAHLALVRHTSDLSQGLAEFTSWAAGVYQDRVTEGLPINRPNRAIWAVPSAWNGDPFLLDVRFPQTNVRLGMGTHDYYMQATRESQRFNGQITHENRMIALQYNLFFQATMATMDPRFTYWSELTGFANYWVHPVNQSMSADPPTKVTEQLDRAVYRWLPEQSPIRMILLTNSLRVIKTWWIIAAAALVGSSILLVVAYARSFIPIWLYWIALIVATSWLGMPAERYIAVAEPLLYTLVWVILFSFGSGLLQALSRISARTSGSR